MSARRVVISGIGVVSTFGVGREVFWDHVRRGISGTRAITEFDASPYPCQVAAPVPAVSMADAVHLDRGRSDGTHGRRLDPVELAHLAGTEADPDPVGAGTGRFGAERREGVRRGL